MRTDAAGSPPEPNAGAAALCRLGAIALLFAPGVVPAEIDLYGRLNVTLQNADEPAGERIELRSNASRIGVRGEQALGSGLTAIYRLEWEVDPDADAGDDHIKPRNQFVGLEGRFGTVKVGRHDTALKEAQGDFDLFNDLEGDIRNVLNGENRLRNYVAWTTPALAKALSVTVNFFPGEDAAAGNDGIADATSAAIRYEGDALYAALARDRDVDGAGVDTTRLVGGYAIGPAELMLLYQRTDAGALDEDGFGASFAWSFGDTTAKLQYLQSEVWRVLPAADPLDNLLEDQLSLGLDRALGERTKVFGFYTRGHVGGTNASEDYLAVGLQHAF